MKWLDLCAHDLYRQLPYGFNTLAERLVRLCVFSIASMQFFDEPMGMALSGGAHVAARFMLTSEPFHGVRSTVEQAARGAPDGYRLLFTYTASMAVNPSLYRKVPYDPIKDFAPIPASKGHV